VPTRQVIEDTPAFTRYAVFDDRGVRVGEEATAKLSAEEQNQQTLTTRAVAALAANDAFLAVGSPTNAQVLAQVRVLTRECSALIRLALQQYDTITGT
jgi:hypothetical protein